MMQLHAAAAVGAEGDWDTEEEQNGGEALRQGVDCQSSFDAMTRWRDASSVETDSSGTGWKHAGLGITVGWCRVLHLYR